MRDFFIHATALQVMLSGLGFFTLMYFSFSAVNVFLSTVLFSRLNQGRVLDTGVVSKKQMLRELGLSWVTILIFGLGVVFPWGLVQIGWAGLAENPSAVQISIEITLLFFWNEIHFYITHRLLHTPWLRRFHKAHHLSITTTPWTTYSFHPVESLMLGSVLMLPMLIHDFSIYALISVPIFSFVINQVGHANYDWFPKSNFFLWQGARRHQLHHEKFHGNFGFALEWIDAFLKTKINSTK